MARYPIQLIPGLPAPELELSARLSPKSAPSPPAPPPPAPPSAAESLGWINRDTPTELWRAPVEIGVYQSIWGGQMYLCGTPGVVRVITGYGGEQAVGACPLSGYQFSVNGSSCEALILGWNEGPEYTATIDEIGLSGTAGLSGPVFQAEVLPGRVIVLAGYALLGQDGGDGQNVSGTATLTVSRDGTQIGSLDIHVIDLGTFDPWA